MTISSIIRKAGPFIGNDSTTAFPYEFKVFTAADLLVVYTDTNMYQDINLVLNTDFTVVLNPDQNANPGGMVTLTAGVLATGFNLTITSDIPPLQAVDLTNQGGFYPQVISNALDKLTILIQQLFDKAGRALTLQVSTSSDVGTELPVLTGSQLLGTKPDGTGFQFYPLGSEPGTASNTVHTPAGTGSTATTVEAQLLFLQTQYAINVKDAPYYAKGDGVTDDTAAIQRAINDSKAAVVNGNGYGSSVYFPRGDYLITDTLLFVDCRGSRYFGEARAEFENDEGSGFLWAGGNAKPMARFDFFKSCLMEDLSFRSLDSSSNVATAVLQFNRVNISGSSNTSQFRRLWIGGAEYGVQLGDLVYNNTYNVSEMMFDSCRITTKFGIYNAGVSSGGQNVNNVFFACHFSGNVQRAFWLDGGNIIADKCTFNGSSAPAATTVLYVTGDVAFGVPTVLRDCYAEQIDKVIETEFTASATNFAQSGLIHTVDCWWNVNNPNHVGTNYFIECYKNLEIIVENCIIQGGEVLYSPPAEPAASLYSSLAPSSRSLQFMGFNSIGNAITTSRGGYIVSQDRNISSTIPFGFVFPSGTTLTFSTTQIKRLKEYGIYPAYGANGTFDLNTITGGQPGDLMYLQGHPTQSTFRIANIISGTGNIDLIGGGSFLINNPTKKLLLRRDTTGRWMEISRTAV